MLISFQCPHCQATATTPSANAGKIIPCPTCGMNLQVPMAVPATAMPVASGFRCIHCGTTAPPIIRQQISTAGWVVFVVMLLVCFPLCFIGLFIKEDYRVCSGCGIRLG